MNRLHRLDLDLCIQFNRISAYRGIELGFRAISRLGNGLFWYGLMLFAPLLFGEAGLQASLHMVVAGLPALAIYKYLKRKTSRPRPCKVHPRVLQKTASLDQFSFPSGHTLHAVNFTLVCSAYLPELAIPLAWFTALVALSRPVLGLHYPSDVLAGAAIGTLIALLALQVPLF